MHYRGLQKGCYFMNLKKLFRIISLIIITFFIITGVGVITSCKSGQRQPAKNLAKFSNSIFVKIGLTLDNKTLQKYNKKFKFLKKDNSVDPTKFDSKLFITVSKIDNTFTFNANIINTEISAKELEVNAYWVSSITIPYDGDLSKLANEIGIAKKSIQANTILGYGQFYKFTIQAKSGMLKGNYISIINAGINHENAEITIEEEKLGISGDVADALSSVFTKDSDIAYDLAFAILNAFKQNSRKIQGQMRLIGYEIKINNHDHSINKNLESYRLKKISKPLNQFFKD